MNRVLAHGTPPIKPCQVLIESRSITASKVYHKIHSIRDSKFEQSWPPCKSPTLLDHSLQVYFQVRMITASNCISKLTQLRPPSLYDHGLQVHLYIQLIKTSKCISKYAQSSPSSASADPVGYSLQVHTIMASWCLSKPPGPQSRGVSQGSLAHHLQVYHQIPSIAAPKCIPSHAGSCLWGVPLSSHNRHIQTHLKLLSSCTHSQS